MANLAATLKSEISRVARKEVRAETDDLRKLVSAQRSAIAALKRELAELRKEIKQGNSPKKPPAGNFDAAPNQDTKRRFSATRLAAHRKKTGLSAADYGALAGISDQSIYHYEQGKARPHADVVRRLSMLKELSQKQLLALSSEHKTSK